MARFHFVEDYERHVANLKAAYPIDEAMALAVGGSYTEIGDIEAAILGYAGLRDGAAVFDLGCGSGRLAASLGQLPGRFEYTGVDIIQDLLDYAKTKTPAHFVFKMHREISIPLPDASVDMATAFSVFTHLLPQETFIYIDEMKRILRPGGTIVFSFLEFAMPFHWAVFENTVAQQRASTDSHLNTFLERNVITVWAERLGLRVQEFINGDRAIAAAALGQSIAILRKP